MCARLREIERNREIKQPNIQCKGSALEMGHKQKNAFKLCVFFFKKIFLLVGYTVEFSDFVITFFEAALKIATTTTTNTYMI